MIDAYTIGIRLALTDDVSAGLARMRGSLLTLDRATAASAGRMRALTEFAGRGRTPSAVGARLLGAGPGPGAAPRLPADRRTVPPAGAAAGDPNGRTRDRGPTALDQHLSWPRFGAVWPMPSKSEPPVLRIPTNQGHRWSASERPPVRPPAVVTARMERLSGISHGNRRSGDPVASIPGDRDRADAKPRRPVALRMLTTTPAPGIASGSAGRCAPLERAVTPNRQNPIDTRPIGAAIRRVAEQVGRLAAYSAAPHTARSPSAMAEPTRPIGFTRRIMTHPPGRLGTTSAPSGGAVAPIHRSAGRAAAAPGITPLPHRAPSAPVGSAMPQGPALPAEVELVLDGVRFGRIVADLIGRELDRPRSGYSGPDPRVSPIWPGAAAG